VQFVAHVLASHEGEPVVQPTPLSYVMPGFAGLFVPSMTPPPSATLHAVVHEPQ
jgi:hypothetical protein